jgi:hypothetical protein
MKIVMEVLQIHRSNNTQFMSLLLLLTLWSVSNESKYRRKTCAFSTDYLLDLGNKMDSKRLNCGAIGNEQ